jgi:hypothetical protein
MSNTIIRHTYNEWLQLAKDNDPTAIQFMKNYEGAQERGKLRYKVAYTQKDMLNEHVYWYQKLADYLKEDVYATGSSIRGYWRSKEEEDAICKVYNLQPKYSDFDFWLDTAITPEEVKKINEKLNPIAKFQNSKWIRSIKFTPNES